MAGVSATGTPRVAVTTLGCKVNYAEMADLAGVLAADGCEIVGDSDSADVRVLNSCAVTLQADATTRQRLQRLRRQDPDCHLILTGCSVDANPQRYLASDSRGERVAIPGVDAVFSNVEKPAIATHIRGLLGDRRGTVDLPAATRSRAFLKVQDGCDHRCTYCVVWRARGPSVSLPLDEILEKAQRAVDRGQQEIVLTGVDLGSYGRERGSSLAVLVRELLVSIGGNARIRLSSINANDITADLAALNAEARLCAHWHIPLQSGSDRILKGMHRGYRRRQYLRAVAALRDADPHTEITSDVMVGFPGETEADHEDTLSLVREVGFLHTHTFRWSPRPGTPATSLNERVADAIAHRRSREVRIATGHTGRAARERALKRRHHDVVWCRVDGEVAEGLTDTWHTVLAAAGPETRTGRLQRVEVTGIEGERLRARLSSP